VMKLTKEQLGKSILITECWKDGLRDDLQKILMLCNLSGPAFRLLHNSGNISLCQIIEEKLREETT
jgi:hypothetical protein